MDSYTRGALEETGLMSAAIMYGDIFHIFPEYRIRKKKILNFKSYLRLYPERKFIFVGDSGQEDTRVGTKMLEDSPNQMLGVFIHNVTGVDMHRQQESAKNRIWFFDNYPHAAQIAFREGLISRSQAELIGNTALREFHNLKFDDPVQQENRHNELQASATQLFALL